MVQSYNSILCILLVSLLPEISQESPNSQIPKSLNLSVFYEKPNYTSFYIYTVDTDTKTVYVGGKQKIFELNYDLSLKKNLTIDNVFGTNSLCEIDSHCSKECSNAYNRIKLLLIDHTTKSLISCGTLNFGFCYKHSLQDITNFSVLNGSSLAADHIMSCDFTSIGIIEKNHFDNSSIFYFARTLDDNISFFSQQSVSTKKWNSEKTGFKLVANVTGIVNYHSYVTVDEKYFQLYKIKYIYGFSHNNFTYFLTTQSKSLKKKKEEIRLVRVCQNDTTYNSYAELTLKCKSSKLTYNIAKDAQLASVSRDFIAAEGLSSDFKMALFVLVNEKSSNSRAFCFFDMDDIEESFEAGIILCNNGSIVKSVGLEFIHGKKLQCGKHADHPIACPNAKNPNPIHQIHVSNALIGKVINLGNLSGKTKKTIPVSFFIFVHANLFTVAAIGTKNGNIIFYHIGGNKNRNQNYISVKFSNQPIKKLYVSDDTKHIFFNDNNSIYRLKILKLCEILSPCHICLRHNFLQCGYCHKTNKCMSKFECNSIWSNTTCEPHIINFFPKSGPTEGNTKIVFQGEALGHTTPDPNVQTQRSVTFNNGLDCDITGPEKYNELACITRSINTSLPNLTLSVTVSIKAHYPPNDVVYDQYSISGKTKANTKFSYVLVHFDNFTPKFGPFCGGTNLTLTGSSLNSGTNSSVNIGSLLCEIFNKSDSFIKCSTAKLLNGSGSVERNVKLTIDGATSVAMDNFTYKPDPNISTSEIHTLAR